MGPLRAANLGLRFLLELGLLAAFALWGAHAGGASVAVAAPLAAAVLWGMVLSPKARVPSPAWVRVSLEVLLFGAAAAGLAADGHAVAGAIFGVVALANLTLVRVFPVPGSIR